MSEHQLSSDSTDERAPRSGAARPDLLGLEPDQIEAARLSDILSAVELGQSPELDPTEDPALASLQQTASMLQSSLAAASAHASFRSFHERSRARVVTATPRPRRLPVVEEPRESLLRRWNGLFPSIASAGAASIATLIVTIIAIGGGSSTAPVGTVQSTEPAPAAVAPDAAVSTNVPPVERGPERVNLTALSINEQVTHYVELLERLDTLKNDGQPAGEHLLRDLAETGATVKRSIEQNPDVSGMDAFVAMHATFDGQQALHDATVATEADQQVLDTAQATAEGAYVTAARFLGDHPDLLPNADDATAALSATSARTAPASSPDTSEDVGDRAQ
jgi:hypothetical protein